MFVLELGCASMSLIRCCHRCRLKLLLISDEQSPREHVYALRHSPSRVRFASLNSNANTYLLLLLLYST